MSKRFLVGCIAMMSFGALTLCAAKYPVVEVDQFDAKAEAKAPPEIGVKLTEDVMKKLNESKNYAGILRSGEKPADSEAKIAKIAGTITAFDAGSRAMRYAVGFGAGKSKITAHVQFVDVASGKVLLESDIENKFSGGAQRGRRRRCASHRRSGEENPRAGQQDLVVSGWRQIGWHAYRRNSSPNSALRRL